MEDQNICLRLIGWFLLIALAQLTQTIIHSEICFIWSEFGRNEVMFRNSAHQKCPSFCAAQRFLQRGRLSAWKTLTVHSREFRKPASSCWIIPSAECDNNEKRAESLTQLCVSGGFSLITSTVSAALTEEAVRGLLCVCVQMCYFSQPWQHSDSAALIRSLFLRLQFEFTSVLGFILLHLVLNSSNHFYINALICPLIPPSMGY